MCFSQGEDDLPKLLDMPVLDDSFMFGNGLARIDVVGEIDYFRLLLWMYEDDNSD